MGAVASQVKDSRTGRGFLACLVCLAVAIFVAFTVASPAYAEEGDGSAVLDSGTCGSGLTWAITDDYVLIISGSGTMDSYDAVSRFAPWDDYKRKLVSVVIEDGCASVGPYAFADYGKLQSVVLPASLNAIGDCAFSECSNLASIGYVNGTGDVRPGFPLGLQQIGGRAFSGCVDLASVVIPDSVTSLGDCAFDGCTGLSSVTLPAIQPSTLGCAFVDCSGLTAVQIPEGYVNVPDRFFYGCTNLSQVDLPSTLKRIGDEAFARSGLTSVEIPEKVMIIGSSAFSGCAGLRSINVPANVIDLSARVFDGCKALESIQLHNELETIGHAAFRNCSSLTEIVVPASVSAMGEAVFAGCSALRAADIKAPLTRLPDYTFSDCASLQTVTLPESCAVIGASAFSWAGSGSFVIPSSVTDIESDAFRACTFTELTIPGSVKTVRSSVIYDSDSIESVILGEGVEVLGDDNLSYCRNLSRLDLPSTITTFGKRVMYAHSPNNLYRLEIPESLVNVPSGFGNINSEVFTCVRQVDALLKGTLPSGCLSPSCARIPTTDGGSVRLYDLYEYGGYIGFERLSSLTGVVPNAIVDYGTCGDSLTFQLTSDGVLHIYGDGAMDDYAQEGSEPWAWYVDEVRKVKFEGNCTRVGAGAFADCEILNQVILPASVESIGKGAFPVTPHMRVGAQSVEQAGLVIASGFTDVSRIFVPEGGGELPEDLPEIPGSGGDAGDSGDETDIDPVEPDEPDDVYGEWGFYQADVALSATKLTYSGKVRHPSVTLTYRGETLREGVDYALEFSEGSKYVGKYQVTITSLGRFGDTGIRGFTYYIVPKKVTSRSLYKSGKYLVAKWYKPSTSFTKYKVQVSTSSSFDSGKTITKYVSKSKKKLTMSGIKKGKTYYFRIMAVKSTANDGLIEGSWSKVKKCRIK